MRGVAALAVAGFHFTNGNQGFLSPGILKSIGSYGWVGVEIFFVISGFVIPYALDAAGYQMTQYGTFLFKRIVRLDPPYLVTVLMIVVLGYVSSIAPGFNGPKFSVSAPQVLLHFAYLNNFFRYDWLNPVFWSLAIEFQYYLTVGLLFGFISNRRLAIRTALFVVLGLTPIFITPERLIFHWLFLFMLGMLAYQWRSQLVDKRWFVIWLLVLTSGTAYVLGPLVAIVALLTTLAICFVTLKRKWFLSIGAISYSIYLVHVPIGMRIVNLGSRLNSGTVGKLGVIVMAFMFTLGTSYLLYFFVEKPSRKLSASISYRDSEVEIPAGFRQRVTAYAKAWR